MKFSYTILYVKDVAQSVAFYEKAFGLKQQFIHESKQYAEMQTGGTTLAFASNELAKSNLPQGFKENSLLNLPAGIQVGFVTDEIAAALSRAIEAGAVVVVDAKVKPWGQTVAYVRDLDGILVEIASSINLN
ncbi:MAG: VOC family protein [Nostoc sp.]|uniref:VOC family protein n=1 Tax=Nostoc sp. TaxID=1180 RepID=UPI002FFC33E3